MKMLKVLLLTIIACLIVISFIREFLIIHLMYNGKVSGLFNIPDLASWILVFAELKFLIEILGKIHGQTFYHGSLYLDF